MNIYLMIAAIWFAIGIAYAVLLTIWPPRVRQHDNVVHLSTARASRVIGQASAGTLRHRFQNFESRASGFQGQERVK